MITLEKIVYVDGQEPSAGQISLDWIQNGTLLQGATKTDPRGGNLNENSARIQYNVQILDRNDHVLKTELEGTQKKIATIEDNIGLSGSVEIIQQVGKNTADIAKNQQDIIANTQKIDLLDPRIALLEDNVGPSVENINRTIHEDLVWIKTRIGHDKDKDINDEEAIGNESTGIIYKLNQVNDAVVINYKAINDLTQRVENERVVDLRKDVVGIRTELGDTSTTPTTLTVYQRLDLSETKISDLQSQQTNIISAIGGLDGTTISGRVDSVETDVNQLQDEVNGAVGLTHKVNDLTQTVNDPDNGLVVKVAKNSDDIAALNDIVGLTPTEGLQKTVLYIEDVIGTKEGSSVVAPGSMEDRLRTAISIQNDQAATIQDIQNTIGTSKSGILGDIAKLNTDMGSAYPFANKTIAVVADGTFTSDMNAGLLTATKGTAHSTSVYAPNGVSSILANVNLANTSTAVAILTFLGTYDYLFDTELGTVADAASDYSGSGSFYNSVYRLFNTIITTNSQTRVYVANGFKPSDFTGSTVKYPAANTKGYKLEDYALAISTVAKMFSVPVIDTLEGSNIGIKNLGAFSNTTGLNAVGKQRILSIVAKGINTK